MGREWMVEWQNQSVAAKMIMKISKEKTMDGAISAAHVLFSSLVKEEGIENWKLVRVEQL